MARFPAAVAASRFWRESWPDADPPAAILSALRGLAADRAGKTIFRNSQKGPPDDLRTLEASQALTGGTHWVVATDSDPAAVLELEDPFDQNTQLGVLEDDDGAEGWRLSANVIGQGKDKVAVRQRWRHTDAGDAQNLQDHRKAKDLYRQLRAQAGRDRRPAWF